MLYKSLCKVLFHVYLPYHGLADDFAVLYGQTQKYRQSVISSVLIFTGAAYGNIVPAVSPVGRYALRKAFHPLGYNVKMEILTLTYHVPAALPPFIGVFKEEVRRHAGKYNAVLIGQLVLSLTVLFQRQIVISSLCNNGSVLADTFVPAVNVAIRTACTYLVTAIPRIPYICNV